MVRVLFTIFLAIDLSALAGVIGRLTVSRSDGLTGAAVIFWYVLFGFAVGLIAGIFISRFLSQKVLKILNYILGIIALAVIMFVFYRLNNIELIESGVLKAESLMKSKHTSNFEFKKKDFRMNIIS